MRVQLTHVWSQTPEGRTGQEVARACVHCGMCNATCPTHLLTGDELDGPRGRIYLMKQVLEGERPTRLTQVHLDRCLSCRACETTCPSGVGYHRLYDAVKPAVDAAVRRPLAERLARAAIRMACTRPRRLAALMRLGRPLAPLLPPSLRNKLTAPRPAGSRPDIGDRAWMSMLRGCVQAAASPRTNAAAARLFDRAGIGLAERPGCCGALAAHTGDHAGARALARKCVTGWTRDLDSGAEAIVVAASGCAAFVRDYGDLLADDPEFAAPARRVAAAVRDPVEVLHDRLPPPPRTAGRAALHVPCTLRNGPGLGKRLQDLLTGLGYDLAPTREDHFCCGSAGAWSLLHPAMAGQLRERKLAALTEARPQEILTANIGCQMHLCDGEAGVPVRHWLEAVDDLYPPS